MTARWSGVEPRTRRRQRPSSPALDLPGERFRAEGGREVAFDPDASRTLAGLPAAPGRQSPEVESIASARDVNVGCRSGAQHLGAVSEVSRKAQRGASSSEVEGRWPG
jgi:hypothetical protein